MMNKVTSIAVGALAALALVAAPSRATAQQDQQTRSGSVSRSDSSAGGATSMPSAADTGSTMADTSQHAGHAGMRHHRADRSGMRADSGTAGAGISDSAKANQTKSGVTNTKHRKSTLGKKVFKTRPDQSQPITAKGDTIRKAADSASMRRQHDST
jgi:hypothetical protein